MTRNSPVVSVQLNDFQEVDGVGQALPQSSCRPLPLPRTGPRCSVLSVPVPGKDLGHYPPALCLDIFF